MIRALLVTLLLSITACGNDGPAIGDQGALPYPTAAGVDDALVHPVISKKINEMGDVIRGVVVEDGLTAIIHSDDVGINVRVAYQTSPTGAAFFGAVFAPDGSDKRLELYKRHLPPLAGLEEPFAALEQSHARISTQGKPTSLHVFYDPLCGACSALYREASQIGGHTVHYVPVDVLSTFSMDLAMGALVHSAENGGDSAMTLLQDTTRRAELVALAADAEQSIRDELRGHRAAFRIKATPTLVWRDQDGVLRAQVGPRGPFTLQEIIDQASGG